MKNKRCNRVVGVAVGLLAMLLVAVSMAFYLHFVQNKMEETLNRDMEQVAQIDAKAIQTKIEDYFMALNALALTVDVDELTDPDSLKDFCRNTAEQTAFQRVGVLFEDGSSTGTDVEEGDLPEIDYQKQSWFAQIWSGEQVLTQPFADPVTGESMVAFSIPLVRDGVQNAVLCGFHRTVSLSEMVDYEIFEGNGYIHIIDSDGNMLFRSAKADLPERKSNVFEDTYIKTNGFKEMHENLKIGKGGTATFLQPGGVEKYVSYMPIGINDWFVGIIVADTYLQKQTRPVFYSSIILAVGIIAVVGTLVWSVMYWRSRGKQMLMERALTDPLTGCGTKLCMAEQIAGAKERYGSGWSLTIFNVCDFRFYNQLFGYAQGDVLLQKVAKSLQNSLMEEESIARVDADRFALLMCCPNQDTLIARVEKLRREAERCGTEGTYRLMIHCGVCTLPQEAGAFDFNKQLDYAAEALKNTDVNGPVSLFDTEAYAQVCFRRDVAKELQFALQANEFELFLQPKYAILEESPRLAGAEALARWNSAKWGKLSPAVFIPVFEANGSITALDREMLEKACKLLRDWRRQELSCVPISVNLSRCDLYRSDLLEATCKIVDSYDLPHELIELEITESAVAEDMTTVGRVLTQLREAGFRVSMDDFGAGYSSLNMVRALDLDVVKLDAGFFRTSARDERAKKITASILQGMKAIDLEVVAEGVEQAEQVEFLRENGCDLVQGYFFGRPVPSEEFMVQHLAKLETNSRKAN